MPVKEMVYTSVHFNPKLPPRKNRQKERATLEFRKLIGEKNTDENIGHKKNTAQISTISSGGSDHYAKIHRQIDNITGEKISLKSMDSLLPPLPKKCKKNKRDEQACKPELPIKLKTMNQSETLTNEPTCIPNTPRLPTKKKDRDKVAKKKRSKLSLPPKLMPRVKKNGHKSARPKPKLSPRNQRSDNEKETQTENKETSIIWTYRYVIFALIVLLILNIGVWSLEMYQQSRAACANTDSMSETTLGHSTERLIISKILPQ